MIAGSLFSHLLPPYYQEPLRGEEVTNGKNLGFTKGLHYTLAKISDYVTPPLSMPREEIYCLYSHRLHCCSFDILEVSLWSHANLLLHTFILVFFMGFLFCTLVLVFVFLFQHRLGHSLGQLRRSFRA